jgi:hypothetical protein
MAAFGYAALTFSSAASTILRNSSIARSRVGFTAILEGSDLSC